jgi:hypothetical protein
MAGAHMRYGWIYVFIAICNKGHGAVVISGYEEDYLCFQRCLRITQALQELKSKLQKGEINEVMVLLISFEMSLALLTVTYVSF